MAKKVSIIGMLVALAMILSYVEVLIPFNFGIPGIKLGLANLVVLIALYVADTKTAFMISMVRIILVAVTFGNLSAMLYSLSGGILSFLAMIVLKRLKGFSIVSVSMVGGICHNIGQILVAAAVVENLNLLYYIPVLVIAGTLTGLCIGLVAGPVLLRIQKNV